MEIKVKCSLLHLLRDPRFALVLTFLTIHAGGNVIEIHSKEEWDKQQADASNAAKVVRLNY